MLMLIVNVATFKSGTGTPTFEAQRNVCKTKTIYRESSISTSTDFLGDISTLQSSLSTANTKIETEKSRIDAINSDISALFVEGILRMALSHLTTPVILQLAMTTRVKSEAVYTGTDIVLTNRDKFLRISKNDYSSHRIGGEYRPLFVSYGS